MQVAEVRARLQRPRGKTMFRNSDLLGNLRGDLRGDHDGNPGLTVPTELRPAAVLVPLVDRVDGISVLLTQRTAHLAAHAGQISFPGGGVEPADSSPEETALRETEEEIGLPRHMVEPLARLDTYVTRTGFQVTPIVGILRPPFLLRPDPNEVAEIFEVPLSFILDPAARQRQSLDYRGVPRGFWVFSYGERYIWGATAGMLVNLVEVLADEPSPVMAQESVRERAL